MHLASARSRSVRLAASAVWLMTGMACVHAEGLQPDLNLVKRLATSLGAPVGGFRRGEVRTVGCPSDGQLGPLPAPAMDAMMPALLRTGDADRLAYYKAQNGEGVLAPRGWKCFSRYGSNGSVLLVAPPEAPAGLFAIASAPDAKTSGPAVISTVSEGSTSGRLEVARVAARVFPAARAFVNAVQAEGIADPKAFTFGPWPADKLVHLSDHIVSFTTAPGAAGLGSTEELAAAKAPIRGEAVLGGPSDAPSLSVLRVRLAGAEGGLYATIAVNALPAATGSSGAAAVAAAANSPAGWESYTNERFKCSARYPAAVFTKPQPEPYNGDGRSFQSDDGATLKISGSNNATSQSAAELERAGHDDPGNKIVYSAAGPAFFVQSGYRGENVYYTRSNLSGDKQTICSFDLEYPNAVKPKYDGLIAAIAATLRAP